MDKKIKPKDGMSNAINVKGEADHDLLEFFLGFLLLGGGIYWVLNSFMVSFSWGSRFYFFGVTQLSAGVMLIPLLVGLFLMFLLDNKAIGGAIASLGLLVILISMITSLSFHPVSNSLYVYVLMFGMIAIGAGLMIRVLFKKKPKNK